MGTKCYRADYDVIKDGKVINQTDEYFWDDSYENVIESAREIETYGTTYVDIGHCDLSLVQIVEVDENTECFNEIRLVYY